MPVSSLYKHNTVRSGLFLFSFALVLLCGCVEHRYYVSPFNGNHSTYHPVPQKSDSVRSGYYAAAAVAVGSANYNSVDNFLAFHASVSGGHNLGALQAFYSFNVAAGRYKVDSAQNVDHPGPKSFTGAGFEGGLHVVYPFDGGEWRVIGVETALWNEQGKYLQFRKALPDGAVDLIIKQKFFGTLGGYTELIANAGNVTVGFRLAGGTVLSRRYYIYDPDIDFGRRHAKYGYLNFTTHLTRQKLTGFLALNFATKADAAVLGLNYRLR